jgi:ClpP class serine protease
MNYPQIAQRVFHTPLLAAPNKAAAFVKGLGPRIIGGDIEFVGVDADGEAKPSSKPYASLLDDRLGSEIRSGERGAYRVIDGVAVIPITGSLIHRGAWVGSFSGETSYEGIGAQIDAVEEDAFVRGVALEIDSHGGEVAGCFPTADRIRALREKKPVQAFICDHAYSAAYAIASQADKVIIPRAGGAGSVGVICLHADFSQQLEDRGVRVTVISAGDRKADGNPYEPLPDDVRDGLIAEMETLRGIFAETVSAGRGSVLTTEAVLQTEAACFLGEAAVEAGLADEVANPKEAFERFVAQVNGRADPLITASKKGKPMSKTKAPENGEKSAEQDAPQATETGTPEAAPQASAPEQPAPKADSGSDQPDAATEERNRVMGILTCEEAKGREDQAKALAEIPGMSVEAAKGILAAGATGEPKRKLSSVMDEADTDLDTPSGATGSEEVNPVKAAHQKRWN